MPSRQPAPYRLAARRIVPHVLLCLSLMLMLIMVSAPWWQQSLANGLPDAPAMTICSVGNTGSGSVPVHPGSAHCQLCCGSHAPSVLSVAVASHATVGISYPLTRYVASDRSTSRTPGSPQARAPPTV